MNIYAIRHTSVDLSPGICYGQSDVDVAPSFEREINEVAARLPQIPVDCIWCSPLQRCRKLAEFLFPGQPITFDSRLKELNFGDWELKSWDEIYALPEGKNWMNNYQQLPTSNGESYIEMKQRIASWLTEVKKANKPEIAVVTHAGVIRMVKHLISGESMDKIFTDFKPTYGSVTLLNI